MSVARLSSGPGRPPGRAGAPQRSKVGRRFGTLTVVAQGPTRQPGEVGGDNPQPSARRTWVCRCDCGREVTILNGSLYSRSGCDRCPNGHRRAPGEASRRGLLANYRHGAKVRGIPWTLEPDYFLGLTKQNCHYCGAPPSALFGAKHCNGRCLYNGVDREDPDKGYEVGNVVSCCKNCNTAKMAQPKGEFLAWIRRVADYQSRFPFRSSRP